MPSFLSFIKFSEFILHMDMFCVHGDMLKLSSVQKPGKNNYFECKSFRPISLMSFSLKTFKKLIDRYLREDSLSNMPLSERQVLR